LSDAEYPTIFGVVLSRWRSRFRAPEGNRDPAFFFVFTGNRKD
jgi:hypothetical protein